MSWTQTIKEPWMPYTSSISSVTNHYAVTLHIQSVLKLFMNNGNFICCIISWSFFQTADHIFVFHSNKFLLRFWVKLTYLLFHIMSHECRQYQCMDISWGYYLCNWRSPSQPVRKVLACIRNLYLRSQRIGEAAVWPLLASILPYKVNYLTGCELILLPAAYFPLTGHTSND